MEIQATPFPGKSQPLKPKMNRKAAIQAPKGNAKEPPIQRQRRVFGTTRNPNIPSKPVADKPTEKKKSHELVKTPSINPSPKNPKPTQPTANTSPDKNRAKLNNKKKKSVVFEEKIEKNPAVVSEGGDRTPVVVGSGSLAKPRRVSGTPYQSAENCSKCRFDRLETSAYWLGQIKLAESVGKHFVSATFFRLALESKAEPIRGLRVELKRYVARHEYLSKEAEWRDVSVSYGLMIQADQEAEADNHSNNGNIDALDQPPQKDLKQEKAMEPTET